MSSALSFTFRPSLIPAQYQAEFLTRVCQLALDYETLTSLPPPSPPADAVPQPSSFAPVQGDGADGETAPATVKPSRGPRKNPWADLTADQRAERLAAMKRGRAARAAERRISEDSLVVPPTEAAPELPVRTPNNGGVNLGVFDAVPAPVPAVAEDAASDSSSAKRARKNPWAGLTPEQHAAKVLAMKIARDAKRAERAAVAAAV
jgi:hypothetical protein